MVLLGHTVQKKRENNIKRIEERAKEYAPDMFKPDCIWYVSGQNLVDVMRQAYTVGAKDQRKIDVMRIRQFLEREAAYNGTMSCVDDLLIEELCKAIEEE